MKKYVLSLLTASLAFSANAQLGYTLTTITDPYVPLTGGTSLVGTSIWTDSSVIAAPLPFAYHLGGTPVTVFNIVGGGLNGMATDTAVSATTLSAFVAMDAVLEDRGQVDGVQSLSPARYRVDGVAPNRIFKAEIANAGFQAEYDAHETMNDSVSYQLWLYEGTDVFEMRYGPAKISDSSDYFNTLYPGLPLIGYVKNVDQNSGSFDAIYSLAGNTSSPYVDSLILTGTQHVPNPISGYPSSGTVYRFTPGNTATGVSAAALLQALTVAPVPCTTTLNITYKQADMANYTILAANGAVVGYGILATGNNPVNVAALPAGTYLLEVKNSTTAAASRFVKM